MINLMFSSFFSFLLIMGAVAVTLVSITSYGTFLGLLIAIPMVLWAQAIRFRVAHTVVVIRR